MTTAMSSSQRGTLKEDETFLTRSHQKHQDEPIKASRASLFRERVTPLLLTLSNVTSGINKGKVLHSVFIWRADIKFHCLRNEICFRL
ncbi:hypothetical protein IRJ41_001567 [Triplophysa rosa]|uniref:Uncharacterized protein n=1 Tax=Triplophysa rosa TaxID=992332 RepID=A0A9W8C5M0_TRIRA|nr:hypothetical protein IRJ41_001567 [Triplophysa rosa]